MKVTFLGQGLESESNNAVGYYLVKYLNSNDFYSFTAISAFVSTYAIEGLTQHIEKAKKSFKELTIIVGIDQGGTSKEALEAIINLNVNSFIFYQSESAIFHPKIYLFEGLKDVKLIIGSSNLTGTGLFVNIESSVLVEFTTDNNDGQKLLADLKDYYNNLLNFTDPNLFKITMDNVENFALKGILPNELIRREKYYKITDGINDDTIIDIRKRQTAKIPSTFKQAIEPENIVADINFEKTNKSNLDKQLHNKSSEIKALFLNLEKRIRESHINIEVKYNPKNIAFKVSKMFAEAHIQADNILLYLKDGVDYIDPQNKVRKVPNTSGYNSWPLKRKVRICNENDLNYIMPIIEQSYKDIL